MSLTRLTFEVRFHGPVRVGTGRAGSGLDDTVDPDVVVPGSSLKGLIRAEAAALFGKDHELVQRVFGTARRPSPWHWGDIVTTTEDRGVAARIRMDSDHLAAVDGGLFLTDHHWPDVAWFDVLRCGPVEPERLREHELLLTASAHAVHSIGGDRNRGYGWVGVRRVDEGFNPAVYSEIANLAGARS